MLGHKKGTILVHQHRMQSHYLTPSPEGAHPKTMIAAPLRAQPMASASESGLPVVSIMTSGPSTSAEVNSD